MDRESSRLRYLAYVLTPLFVLFADLSSKHLAEGLLTEGKSIHIVDGLVQFTLVYNYWTALGLFSTSAPFLAISLGKIVVILALFACFLHVKRFIQSARHQLLTRICVLAIIGGSSGNVIDRLLDRRVTDFIDIGIQTFRWHVSNVADAIQVVGGLIVLSIMASQSLKTRNA